MKHTLQIVILTALTLVTACDGSKFNLRIGGDDQVKMQLAAEVRTQYQEWSERTKRGNALMESGMDSGSINADGLESIKSINRADTVKFIIVVRKYANYLRELNSRSAKDDEELKGMIDLEKMLTESLGF